MPQYLRYMYKSLRKRFFVHLGFALMMSCAFILPSIFTLVLDSARYSTKIESEKNTGIFIHNATESDVGYFSEIEGVDVTFSDGTLSVKAVSGFYKDSQALTGQLITKIMEIDDGRLQLEVRSYDASADERFAAQWLFIICVFIAISMLIVSVIYHMHLGNFKSDIGILKSIGASRKQIRNIFFMELLVSFIFAILLTQVISYFGTSLLYKYYLQVESVAGGSMSLMVFHADFLHMFILAVIAFIFVFIVFVLQFKNLEKIETVNLLSSTPNDDKLKHYKRGLALESAPVSALSALLLRRSGKVFYQCLLIVIPMLTVSLFILNYVTIQAEDLRKTTDFGITLQKKPVIGDYTVDYTAGFSPSEIEKIETLPDTSEVRYRYNLPEGDWVVVPNATVSGQYPFIEGEDGNWYLLVSLRPFSDIAHEYADALIGDTDKLNGGFHVALNKNYAYGHYAVGDEITLLKRYVDTDTRHDQGGDYAGDREGEREPLRVRLTVAALIDMPFTDNALTVFLSDPDFQAFLDGALPNVMEIRLADGADDVAYVEKLKSIWADSDEIDILNGRENERNRSRTAKGIYILMNEVLCLTFFFILTTLYLMLSEYARRQKNNIEVLHILGTSKKDLALIYTRQTLMMAAMGSLVPFALGLSLSFLFFRGSGYHMTVKASILTTYAVSIGMVFIAFLLPVRLGIKRILKTL